VYSTRGTKDAYRVLVGEPEGKRQRSVPRLRWEDNIKIGLRKMGWGGMDWISMAHDKDQWRALVNKTVNLRAP
jgi:hypothetical protein